VGFLAFAVAVTLISAPVPSTGTPEATPQAASPASAAAERPGDPAAPPPAPATAALTVADPGPAPGERAVTPVSSPEDPLEGTNRRLYGLNLVLDRFLFRPVAVTYRRLLPKPVRKGIHNALRNWDEPSVAVNDVLQRRFSDAGRAAFRFGLNTTVGLAGVFDVAAGQGVIHHENGFGLTMARYGIGNGPYMYLPFAGPSTARQLFGALVDIGTNPLTNIRHIRSKTLESVQSVVSVVDTRATLDDDLHDIAVTATDPYASIRSIYLQTLESQVRGDMISLEDSPDIPGAPELPDRHKTPEAGPRATPAVPSDPLPKTPTVAAPAAASAGPGS
jgi:phospholipid-binding lipoprotein MlaA